MPNMADTARTWSSIGRNSIQPASVELAKGSGTCHEYQQPPGTERGTVGGLFFPDTKKNTHTHTHIRVFAENSVGLGFLYSVSNSIKSIPTHEKLLAVGKVAQMPLLT